MPAASIIDIRARVVAGGERAFGPGKADLLEKIGEEGSISAAAKAMNMSYSRAWRLVDGMNASFRTPLVDLATGGRHGGGASVTDQGREVLEAYRRLQVQLAKSADAFSHEFEKRLK